jgi:hypothetical protein
MSPCVLSILFILSKTLSRTGNVTLYDDDGHVLFRAKIFYFSMNIHEVDFTPMQKILIRHHAWYTLH